MTRGSRTGDYKTIKNIEPKSISGNEIKDGGNVVDKVDVEKQFTLEQVWDAVYKASEGQAITFDRHDLADNVCDALDEIEGVK